MQARDYQAYPLSKNKGVTIAGSKPDHNGVEHGLARRSPASNGGIMLQDNGTFE